MEHTTIAVDLAKSVFQVAVSHRAGPCRCGTRLSRDRVPRVFRAAAAGDGGARGLWVCPLLGPTAPTVGPHRRLLPAHDVRPYVRRNKTDRTDAKGLLEANRNEEIQPVPVKTIEQQAIASLHRLRVHLARDADGATEHGPRAAARIRHLHPGRGAAGRALTCGRSARVDPACRAPCCTRTLAAACDEIDSSRRTCATVDRQLATLATH